MSEPTPPRVGVSVIVRHQGKILVGKRRGSHGAGQWGLPGGKIDPNEHANFCAMREVYEETGLTICPPTSIGWSHAIWEDPDKGHQNWVTLVFDGGEVDPSQVRIVEPDKCEEWRFVAPKDLKKLDLFPPLKHYLANNPKKL